MKITSVSQNYNQKPAFQAKFMESGKLAKVVPTEKLEEFKEIFKTPKYMDRILNIKIEGKHPLIIIGDKPKNVEAGTEHQIFAYLESVEEEAPLLIKPKMTATEIVENLIESIGNACQKVRESF